MREGQEGEEDKGKRTVRERKKTITLDHAAGGFVGPFKRFFLCYFVRANGWRRGQKKKLLSGRAHTKKYLNLPFLSFSWVISVCEPEIGSTSGKKGGGIAKKKVQENTAYHLVF